MPRLRIRVTRRPQSSSEGSLSELFAALEDPARQSEAVAAVNDFTRIRMRGDGFFRRILPPLPITNDELDRRAIALFPELTR